MAELDEGSSHWVSSVPEVFYDLIAFILPGFVLLSTTTSLVKVFILLSQPPGPPLSLFESKFPNGVAASITTVVMGIATCWAIGFLLNSLSGLLTKKAIYSCFIQVTHNYHLQFEEAEQLGILRPLAIAHGWTKIGTSSTDVELCQQTYWQLHEYLKSRRPAWQAYLAKSQANNAFYSNVSAAMLVDAVLSLSLGIMSIIPRVNPSSSVWGIAGHAIQSGALFILSILLVLIAWLSWRGFVSGLKRGWLRHLGTLHVDMLESKRIAAAATRGLEQEVSKTKG